MTKEEVLFLLVRSALWGDKIKDKELSPQAYAAIMELADKQTLTGLVCHALIENNVRLQKIDAVNTYAVQRDIVNQNKVLTFELVALTTLLQRYDIHFAVVKGQILSVKYPRPDIRVPGDIDFYCSSDHFPKALEVICREWQVEIDDSEFEESRHITFVHNGVVFEMHDSLSRFSSVRYRKYFEKWLEEAPTNDVVVNGVSVPVLEPTLNLVYTFNHLWKHLIELGVGLRQFCDIAVLLKERYMQMGSRSDELVERLMHLGLMRPFKVVEGVLKNKLGVDDIFLPIPISSKDVKYEKMILDIVYRRGNFGKYGRKNAVRSGWRYYVEALGVKLRHYGQLFWLCPREHLAALCKVVPAKIVRSLLRNH